MISFRIAQGFRRGTCLLSQLSASCVARRQQTVNQSRYLLSNLTRPRLDIHSACCRRCLSTTGQMHNASLLVGTGSQLFVQVFLRCVLQVRMYDHFDMAGVLTSQQSSLSSQTFVTSVTPCRWTVPNCSCLLRASRGRGCCYVTFSARFSLRAARSRLWLFRLYASASPL